MEGGYGNQKGRYCFTENGAVRFEYLPVGTYILKESVTPSGYATAESVLFEITDTGHLELIHQVVMKDDPLRLKISKNIITGGKEVAGASMGIYPVDENGKSAKHPWCCIFQRKMAVTGTKRQCGSLVWMELIHRKKWKRGRYPWIGTWRP